MIKVSGDFCVNPKTNSKKCTPIWYRSKVVHNWSQIGNVYMVANGKLNPTAIVRTFVIRYCHPEVKKGYL